MRSVLELKARVESDLLIRKFIINSLFVAGAHNLHLSDLESSKPSLTAFVKLFFEFLIKEN
jgi:hypothetical protein